MNIKKMLYIVLAFAALALPSAFGFAADNTILSSQTFFYQGQDGQLVIQFEIPMNYISHFPAQTGKRLKITMKELLPSQQNTGSPTQPINDRFIISKNNGNPFSEISYQQEPGQNGELSIEFTREIDFSMSMSRDRKSLTIQMQKVKSEEQNEALPEHLKTGLPIYILNLKTSSSPITPDNETALQNYKKYDIYINEQKGRFKSTYSLHLGYFYSLSVAKANLKILKSYYPGAWVGKVEETRTDTAEQWLYDQRLAQLQKKQQTPGTKPDKLDTLMERARQAMLDKNYRGAIRLFTRILQLGGGKYKKIAKELLGVARERNNQFAHAKFEYQEYLKLYPEGEDAERVKQRLLGLLTAASRPKEKLKETDRAEKEPQWDTFGSIFQFYRYQRSATDTTPVIETDNSLTSDFIYTGRKRGFDFNQRFSIGGSHRADFINSDKSDGRIHTFYYDISKRDDSYGGRIGRQSHSSDGVYGRFDGLILHKRIGSHNKLNFLLGSPVELSVKDAVNTDRIFYGMSMDFEKLFADIDSKIYIIEQTNEEFTDRRAIGSQFKYIDDNSSYFATLDYDILYSELNQFTFIATWRNKANSSLNIIADHRKSPFLTTNNALIGQTVSKLSQLKANLGLTDDEVQQIAIDRTSDYSALTISASTYLSKDYQLNADLTASKFGATNASAGVPATPSTDTEYFFNTTLVVSNFLTQSDTTIFGLRYTEATTSDILQFNISSNINFGKKWRVNPRLITDIRDNINGSSRTTYKPKMIIHYRPSRSIKYEFEMGYEEANTKNTLSESETHLFAFIGYIYDF